MKFATQHALVGLVFGLAFTAGGADVAAAQCPNMRAVQQLEQIQESSTGSRCRRALSILGVQIGLGGSHCPDTITIRPAHRACQSFPDSGTGCRLVGSIDVRVRNCICSEMAEVDLGLTLASCSCSPGGNAGTVDDHETYICITPI